MREGWYSEGVLLFKIEVRALAIANLTFFYPRGGGKGAPERARDPSKEVQQMGDLDDVVVPSAGPGA